MNLFNKIKNFFWKGGAKTGMLSTLNSVVDHPKISMNEEEYRRVRQTLSMYEGKYPEIEYKNSNRQTKKRTPSTINMLKRVANQYSTVVFNEQCEITVEGSARQFVEEVFAHNDFKKNFSKYLEPMFALGGLACRPYFDNNTKTIEFSWALADAFYPLESNTNNISEGALTFVTTRIEGNKTIYYTLLEFHEWENDKYIVTNELYRSEFVDKLGTRYPLQELYPDLEESMTITDLTRPLFAYLKPAGFNNINPYSVLGLGVCDNCKHTLERINRTYDEFNQEIKRGKRRIAVSEMLLSGRVDKEKESVELYFDDDDDTFQIVPGANMEDMTIKDLSADIRTAEYTAAINHHLRTLEMETGLSVGTFTFDTNGVRSTKTATEVVSENSQTYQTRGMQIIEVEKFIKELIVSVCELGKLYKVYSGKPPSDEEIGIDFQDGSFQDKSALADYYLKLFNAGLIPGELVLESLLDIPENEATKLYKRSMQQTASRTTGIFEGVPEEME